MTAVAPEGHRAKRGLLVQELMSRQQLLQGEECSAPAAERRMGRPANDTGRRPEVPADVGPMINMQSGQVRYSFLAGAAHDGDGVLSSSF